MRIINWKITFFLYTFGKEKEKKKQQEIEHTHTDVTGGGCVCWCSVWYSGAGLNEAI